MRELSGHRQRRGALDPLAELPLGAPLRGRAVHARGVRRRGGGRLGARPRAGGVPRRSSPAGPSLPYAGALELVAAVQATVPAGFLSNMNSLQWDGQLRGDPAHRRLRLPLPLLRARPGQARPRRSSTPWRRGCPVPRDRVLFLDDNASTSRRPPQPGSRPGTCAGSTPPGRALGRGRGARGLSGRPGARRAHGSGAGCAAPVPTCRPWLPTARCCVSCRASATTSPSSGPRARTACCASCAATPAGSSSTRRARSARAASRATSAPQAVSGRGHVETLHRQLPAVDPRQRPLHHRLGVHRRAARRRA